MKETAGSAWPILLYGVSAIVLLALAAPTDLSASSKASDGEQQRIDSPIGNPEDAANVLDDLCRFHGDQVVRPSSVVPSSADHRSGGGGHSASIDVVHEIFDPTFGLAPYISYTGRSARSRTINAGCNSNLYDHQLGVVHLSIVSLAQKKTFLCFVVFSGTIPWKNYSDASCFISVFETDTVNRSM